MESMTSGKNGNAIRDYVSKNRGMPLILILASLVCLIAAVERCANDNCSADGEEYAVAGAAVSTVVILVYMFYDASKGMEETAELLLFAFLFIWWAVYAGYTTFRGTSITLRVKSRTKGVQLVLAPFRNTTNGYFGAWLGFIAATGLVVSKTKNAPSFLQYKAEQLGVRQAIILVFSVVVIIAGIPPCCGDTLAIVALVAGAGSILFILLRVLLELESEAFAVFLW